MSKNPEGFFEFGSFRVDASQRLLFSGNEVVPITPKAFDLLLVLVESNGHLLTKEELMKRVWPDSFVEEANLSHNIYKLREALGEGHNGEKFIETVPRRGYRFVAKVTEGQDHTDDFIVEEHSQTRIGVEEDQKPANVIDAGIARPEQRVAPPSPLEPRHFSIPKRGVVLIAGTVLIGLIAGSVYFWRTRHSRSTVNSAGLRSIAVLPFKPLVPNDRDESLEMGMAETLITRLSHIGQITVRPTSAVRQYTKLEDDTVRAGRELRVDAVLDGSIQKSGDRVRVSVRLVQVEPGQTLWAEQFDEKLTDIFTVQDAISRRVGDMLTLRLSGEEKKWLAKRGTDDLEAYQAYLLGRFHWNKLTGEDLRKSIEYFNQALARDPQYALAYAGLADTYLALPTITQTTPSGEANIKAKEAALKALAIDDTIAEAHTSLAGVKELYEWDFAGAEREFKRAIELTPSYITAHIWYSQFLSSVGRHHEAIAEAKRALEVDPTSLYANVHFGGMYYEARELDKAMAQFQTTIAMDKNYARAHAYLANTYLAKERYEDAIAEYEKANVLSGRSSPEEAARKATILRSGYQKSGAKGFWEKWLGLRIENMKKGSAVSPTALAQAYARSGDKDRAFEWLEKAYTERDQFLFYNIKVERDFDSLRSDPRYANLLRRIGLPQ